MNSYTGDFHPDDGPSVDDLANQIEQEAAQEQEKFAAPGPRQGDLPTPNPSTISITEKKPLRRQVTDPTPFPVEALGEKMAKTARALASISKAPIEACACVLLSVMNLVAQSLANLSLPHGKKAMSLYILVMMPSGERKSSVFNLAFLSIREFEQALRVDYSDGQPLPVILVQEATIDGLTKFMGESRGSLVWATDEAAIFASGH